MQEKGQFLTPKDSAAPNPHSLLVPTISSRLQPTDLEAGAPERPDRGHLLWVGVGWSQLGATIKVLCVLKPSWPSLSLSPADPCRLH